MPIKNNSKNEKKIYFVIGLGRSGFWAAKYLRSLGKKVIVWESNENEELSETKEILEKLDISVCLNKQFLFEEFSECLNQIEAVVISPAIPIDHKTIIKLKEKGIEVLGEVNIAWESLKNINWIGITGTNGKTTVTHLLSHILRTNNLLAPFAGNIGTPLCKIAYSIKSKNIDWLVAELSSYQIEIATLCIKPKIGIWTTFTADHLDRHKTLDNYFKIKNSLLKQSEFRIYNYDDIHLRENFKSLSKGIWITTSSKQSDLDHCDYWINNEDFIVERQENLLSLKNFKLKGNHNTQNLLLAIAAARKIGLSPEKIKNALLSYEQLPHRMETIYQSNKLEIINDSKATNFDSSTAGIKAIKGAPIIISGGKLKSGSYIEWVNIINKKAKAVFLFGESSQTLKKLILEGGFKKDIFIFNDLSEVINYVYSYIENNQIETLLFSPSCSSFDQFRNYEERGDIFKKLIHEKFNLKLFAHKEFS
ncbi:UDP-N-acetylmuramoylalanine--D-glutamate ligase [Prochlorococcus marinus str. MIT 9515]|uniref:UDP-N-acetylmuramoylalanine--D-glutamate ligase n=1 Tax=Prochlorococcus marinus (strain MIT 9515) TaxID=167542 RepID=MURD_PROM5|nr:UDP-N-acetylmuramoyl-L-alanine--D-glutamate ligase [Prochlorococcus marinus]A2BY75.1 RecName: Full=UDP-N-acetylmuramoylalanine--D-glutamate ligase; AltName: Full=D-glutamic acid-adding enzyme; AltName: Full=UDP-N-acetylmuramoyl-L-alanyl-D-glutamate synthetase [Prochlorococcus marinus str. MIT 9515]ABM72736.1 UDP-N-acetylmuramoylalanine--D-glutamate ligase [Prochlorococcus marinus str. MIT 9515]